MVSFAPPPEVGPLLPDPNTPNGDPTQSRPAPRVQVPLEPIIAGGVTAMINGLALGKQEDGALNVDEVRETGFPRAVHACLDLYFPDLPIDHPLTALIASGASLGMLVASRKGIYADRAPPETTPQNDDAQPEPEDQPEPQTGGTGDPYWDGILAQAGGVAE